MVTQERDDNEATADYYNERIGMELEKMLAITQDLAGKIGAGQSMTYGQFLTLERAFEYVRDAMHSRDKFGTHSRTGKDRFRHIAHPEQYPAPAETALV
jgi:hypothetical protein